MKPVLILATLLICLSASAVEIIAHRGASADAPENTVASARLAWKQNADAVEIDIYLSRDGRIVAFHDTNTKRITGKDAKVSEQTFDELRQLDAGAWKAPRWKGERIPAISEILSTVPSGKKIVIEIKCGPEVIRPLKRALFRSRLSPKQIVIIGFSYDTMTEVKRTFPRHECYWLSSFKQDKKTGTWTPTLDELVRKARRSGFEGINLSYTGPIDDAFVKRANDAGLKVLVWTVNDAEAARRLAKAGVVGITTDKPAWLRAQLQPQQK